MTPRKLIVVLLTLAAVGSGAAVAGCGGADDEGEGASNGASADEGVAHARSQVEEAKALPEFEPPGPPFEPDVEGKRFFDVPVTTAIPFVAAVVEAEQEVIESLGGEFQAFPNQGDPNEWAQGVEAARTQNADVLLLLSSHPDLIRPQLEAAESDGIPIIETLFADVGYEDFPDYITASVSSPYRRAARLMADYAIADSNGSANILSIVSDDSIPSNLMEPAMEAELGEHCPDCSIEFVNVPLAQFANRVSTTVQSRLNQNPDINYVIPMFDGAAQFAVAGIRSAGAGEEVKVISFNGTPAVLDMIREDNPIVIMDIGQPVTWIGAAIADQAFRLVTGEEPVEDSQIPLRIFDSTNVAEAGNPAELDVGYGDAYVPGYAELWGVDESRIPAPPE